VTDSKTSPLYKIIFISRRSFAICHKPKFSNLLLLGGEMDTYMPPSIRRLENFGFLTDSKTIYIMQRLSSGCEEKISCGKARPMY
jgi:hypothetical protein